MKTDAMSWIDEAPEGSSKFFKMVEGDNRVQLLSHLERYLLKWNGTRYVPAEEGDQNVSVKGVGYVLQDGMIKEATLPYTVVKAIRELMNDEDYAFEEFPMPRLINIKVKNAGKKEAEYVVVPSPKETEVPQSILAELALKPNPAALVAQMHTRELAAKPVEADVNPFQESDDVPF